MKKVLLTLAGALLMSFGMLAESCYTLTFKEADSDSSTAYSAGTAVTNVFSTASADYVASIGTTNNCYPGNGNALKMSSGNVGGSMVINLSEAGQVNVTKISVKAKAYKTDQTHLTLTVNGETSKTTYDNLDTDAANWNLTFDGEEMTTLQIAADSGKNHRCYVYSITVYYEEQSGPKAPKNPVISAKADFVGSTTVSISAEEDALVYYLINSEADPDPTFGTLYEGPFDVDKTCTIKACAVRDNLLSGVAELTVTRWASITGSGTYKAATDTEAIFTGSNFVIASTGKGAILNAVADGSTNNANAEEVTIANGVIENIGNGLVLKLEACGDGYAIKAGDVYLDVNTSSNTGLKSSTTPIKWTVEIDATSTKATVMHNSGRRFRAYSESSFRTYKDDNTGADVQIYVEDVVKEPYVEPEEPEYQTLTIDELLDAGLNDGDKFLIEGPVTVTGTCKDALVQFMGDADVYNTRADVPMKNFVFVQDAEGNAMVIVTMDDNAAEAGQVYQNLLLTATVEYDLDDEPFAVMGEISGEELLNAYVEDGVAPAAVEITADELSTAMIGKHVRVTEVELGQMMLHENSGFIFWDDAELEYVFDIVTRGNWDDEELMPLFSPENDIYSITVWTLEGFVTSCYGYPVVYMTAPATAHVSTSDVTIEAVSQSDKTTVVTITPDTPNSYVFYRVVYDDEIEATRAEGDVTVGKLEGFTRGENIGDPVEIAIDPTADHHVMVQAYAMTPGYANNAMQTLTFVTTGINGINADQNAAEYYNLQGIRVANPENGVYVVRRGGKVTKETVK